MTRINVLGKKGKFKKLRSTPPAGAKRPASVMTLEATVDVKPQELRRLRSFFAASLLIPGHLSGEAQIVLRALFDCFTKQKEVKEGLIGDLMWGFAQGHPAVPEALTVAGLRHLERAGYVRFQAKDNSFVSFESDKIAGAWVRYQNKLLSMIYEDRK